MFSTFGQFESWKTDVVLFFLSNSTQIILQEAFIKYMYAYFGTKGQL